MNQDELAQQGAADGQQQQSDSSGANQNDGDPFEGITDLEELRTKASEVVKAEREEKIKYKSIVDRHREKPEAKPNEVVPPANGNFATKEDLATIQAKEIVPPEVKEHWNELLDIPLAGYNPLDAQSIAANMNERLALLKARKGSGTDTGARELQTSTGAKGSVGESKPSPKDPPRFKLPTQPKDWYPQPK